MKLRPGFKFWALIVAMTLVATSVFPWTQFFARNLTGISVNSGDLVFHLGNRAHPRLPTTIPI